ncbi:MAG: hypothetical protein IPG79_16495 [Saprospiraceae bacterium]|nr:hypothetical protein [Saprospiraceae bacterium]
MGQSIPMVFSDNKATIDMMGQKMEINFEGAFINDGPASDYIVAGLPLKEGYTLHFQMPDIMTMKAKKVTLTTKGMEEMNGVSYHKVEVVNNDNPQDIITFWINPSTKQADKMTQVIPAYQNAVLTMTKK